MSQSDSSPARSGSRLDWVDVAKGICIILVVMMHSTHGVEKALGEPTALAGFVAWCQPFRLPDFFLISGLFVATQINAPWSTFLDKKVVHLAYFYVLWLHILMATKAVSLVAAHGVSGLVELYLQSYVIPFGPIWFLYLLVVLFVVTKALSRLPVLPVFLATVVLNVAVPDTGIFILDELKSKLVFFFAGYAFARTIFAYADEARSAALPYVLLVFALWAAVHTMAIETNWAHAPGVALFVSFAGIGGVITTSVLLVRLRLAALFAYCGRNSVKIYVAFTLFMGPTRVLLMKLAPALPGEAVALASMLAGLVGALSLAWLVEGTPLGWLFKRPRREQAQVSRRRVDAAVLRP